MDISKLTTSLQSLVGEAVTKTKQVTQDGKNIDKFQVLSQAIAYAATELSVVNSSHALIKNNSDNKLLQQALSAGIGYNTLSCLRRLGDIAPLLKTDEKVYYASDAWTLARELSSADATKAIGRDIAEHGGKLWPSLPEELDQIRTSVRTFADKQIAPHAERIHSHDELIPESFVTQMSEMGYFGLSIPEEYDGFDMGNLAMILTTEELSRASLAAAGSLITRPEILAKALLAGGTSLQKKTWLPRLASGKLMVGISVTEPNVGSDVASLSCKATQTTLNGKNGYVITGAKSWCTFAGRANILAVLARTNPDTSLGAKGLSIFIVEKDAFLGHEFTMDQPSGGKLSGKADKTPGYRGMHSFTLAFDNYFVPEENLVGGAQGVGKGFYLQMAGFVAGRLQTAGRACGLSQAALEKTCSYVTDRRQFGHPLSTFPLTQFELGKMTAQLAVCRAITYDAAQEMDIDPRKASLIAAQAKLFCCDIAVWLTQRGQLLHGGWGYAEEYAISRYVVDAQVLPIFEGVKPVLELKVVARSILKEAKKN